VKGLLGSLYLKDLAQKTRRGQAGVNRDGRHKGGAATVIGRYQGSLENLRSTRQKQRPSVKCLPTTSTRGHRETSPAP
jgi:hypothetical protein